MKMYEKLPLLEEPFSDALGKNWQGTWKNSVKFNIAVSTTGQVLKVHMMYDETALVDSCIMQSEQSAQSVEGGCKEPVLDGLKGCDQYGE